MILTSLELRNFRSYQKREFGFSPRLTLVVGPNTSGKTNLLEAVYFLSFGKSFRADTDIEMISQSSEFSRVKGDLDDDGKVTLEILLTKGQVVGKKTPKKKYLINGVPKRLLDYQGSFQVVLFWPQDLQLVTNSPSIRRKYLDRVLQIVDKQYRLDIVSYERGVRLRNKILLQIQKGRAKSSQLQFFNQLLIKAGNYLTSAREEFINSVNSFNFLSQERKFDFKLEYYKNIICESGLTKYYNQEVLSGMTLIGPHRDDFGFLLTKSDWINTHGKNLAHYGSRGEQRLAVIWLKMAELEYVREATGIDPILLLDDIFSELDSHNQLLIKQVLPQQQTIITSTSSEIVEKLAKAKATAEVEIINLGEK